MRKIFLWWVVMLLWGACVATDAYGFALFISPPSVETTVKPGGSASGTITIRNESEKDIAVKVYVQDWLYNPDGTKSFHEAGSTPLSCAKWITVFPKKVNVRAKDKIGVQYSINLPEDAAGGYYAVIFFESIPMGEFEGKQGVMIQLAGRLGSIIYVETEGRSTRKAVIRSLAITPPQSDRPLEMLLSYENTGNVHIRAEGMLNIIDEEGNVYGKRKVGPLNTLPGETRTTKVYWYGELEEGSYDAIVTLDIGTEEPLVEEAKLSIFFGGAISALKVDANSGKPIFSVLVENKGHLNIDTGGKIEVRSEDDRLVGNANLSKSIIAPGRERILTAALEEKLPPGSYTAKAIVSIGTAQLTKEEVFVIP